LSTLKPKNRPFKKLIAIIRKYFRRIVLSVNLLVAFALLFSYLSPYISPVDFYGFAFLGLFYSFLLFVNLLFIVFWAFMRSKRLLISLLTVLIGWSFLTSFFQISFNKKVIDHNKQDIKVLTYNVRVFNRWNWSKEKNLGMKTINYIKKTGSDIVCLQEFYSDESNGKNTVDSIKVNSKLKNAHISYATRNNKTFNHGIATFTSYPIVEKGKVKLKQDENFCIYTDLQIDKDTVRVYNLHLESIHLGYDDYHLIENINNTDTINVRGIRSILSKLKRGYTKRARQADVIAAHIETCQYPVIICGDFNDTPVSYVYKRLTKRMLDTFQESGNGIGSTYINKYSTFRIDFVLHSANLLSFNHRTPRIEFSDHYPVLCSLKLK
jgi:endonuclease/exonuclease/phosphatase family metal-dependent hydrolase